MYDLDFKRAGPILVPFDVPAIVAANVMRLFNTSCVGVMNERNQLVGNLSGELLMLILRLYAMGTNVKHLLRR